MVAEEVHRRPGIKLQGQLDGGAMVGFELAAVGGVVVFMLSVSVLLVTWMAA